MKFTEFKLEQRDGAWAILDHNGEVKYTHPTKKAAMKQLKAIYANMEESTIRLSEQFALGDLVQHAVSDITKEYLFDREHGGGNNTIRLHDVQWRGDKLYIHYRTYPTYASETSRVLSNGESVKADFYDTLFELDAVEQNLGDAETYKQFNAAEQIAVLRDFLEQGMARVYCNCEAFHKQAHWENLAKLDSSIFPFPGPKGTGVWTQRHSKGLQQKGISICKHIAAAIHTMLRRDIRTINQYILKK